jgi:hypothetical protein
MLHEDFLGVYYGFTVPADVKLHEGISFNTFQIKDSKKFLVPRAIFS